MTSKRIVLAVLGVAVLIFFTAPAGVLLAQQGSDQTQIKDNQGSDQTQIKDEGSDQNQIVSIELPNPLGKDSTICTILKKIIGFMQIIAVPILTAMIIYGAYQMLVGGLYPDKIKAARQTFIYAVVGYAIIVIGWGFVFIINEVLGGGKSLIC